MALTRPSAISVAPKNQHFKEDCVPGLAEARLTAYRCECCGEEVAFDVLAAVCRCSEEFYRDRRSAPTPPRGNVEFSTSAGLA